MGKARVVCEYCNKSYEASSEARRRHSRGRKHKANVKLWYDSFADQEQHAAAATAATAATGGPAARHRTLHAAPSAPSAWTPATAAALPAVVGGPPLVLQNLPPSMLPAPPTAFYHCRADWG